jgi:hypothetical protein
MPHGNRAGFCFGEAHRAFAARAAGLAAFLLDHTFIDIGGICLGADPGIGEQALARAAGRGKD